jgi:hypothetical protein
MTINKQGVNIKKNILPKIYVQGPTQTRLLFSMDYEKGKLNITVLESKDKNKVTNISIDLYAINPINKMDLHMQSGEMINKYIMITSIGLKKLQTMNEKIRGQLKFEKFANKTRQMRVEELEQWVID